MKAEYVLLVLQLIVLIAAVFGINRDSKRREIGGRIRGHLARSIEKNIKGMRN